MNFQLFIKLQKGSFKVIIEPFFNKLLNLFPNKPFEIYEDSGIGNGPYIFYPKYSEWSEYKKGEKLGISLKNKKVSSKKVLQRIKQWKKLPEKTNKQLLKKLLIIEGFNEGWSGCDQDIIGCTSWVQVKNKIKEIFEITIDDLIKY